ncbi:MAG: hypothetical protein R6V17_04140 [Halanaerobacter sp.]
MMNVFKDMLATGLGAVFLTKEKIEEMVGKLVEEGSVSKQEAEELIDNMVEKAKTQREELKSKLKREIKNEFEKTGVSNQEEVKNLKGQVDRLELQVKALEKEIADLKDDSIEGVDSDS